MSRAFASFFRSPAGTPTPDSFRYVFAALSGAALSFSFTGFYLSIYSYVCIGILLIVVFGARPRVAFFCGMLHMFFFIITSVPWIATVLAEHGGVPQIAGWGLSYSSAFLSVCSAARFAWCVNRLAQRSILLACVGAPFLWVTLEFLREHFPEISFPWGLLGYPSSANPGLLQITTLTGIYGLSFFAASINAIFAWCDAATDTPVRIRVTVLVSTLVLLIAVVLIAPRFVPEAHANHYARAVQLNFPEVGEYPATWYQQHDDDLKEIEQLSIEPSPQNPDLLIWPETPAPFSFEDARFLNRASQLAVKFGHPFLAGSIEWRPLAPHWAADDQPHAGAVQQRGAGRCEGAQCFHLRQDSSRSVRRIRAVSADPSRGEKRLQRDRRLREGNQISESRSLPNGYTFSAFICYEAIYPGEIRQFAAEGAQLFINISNDGWFGHSAAAEQHLRIARVRAVGKSAMDAARDQQRHHGVGRSVWKNFLRRCRADVRAAVDLPYDFRTDETMYTRYGDWFAWLCVIVSAILLATTFRKGNVAGEGIPIPVGLSRCWIRRSQRRDRVRGQASSKRRAIPHKVNSTT